MEYQEIINLINGVGFPIVACVFMYRQYINTLEKISELTKAIADIKIALQSNTDVINRLSDKWGV